MTVLGTGQMTDDFGILLQLAYSKRAVRLIRLALVLSLNASPCLWTAQI
jgi:hypothetical protein